MQNHLTKIQIKERENEALEREQFFDFMNRRGRFFSASKPFETEEDRIAAAILYFGKDYR